MNPDPEMLARYAAPSRQAITSRPPRRHPVLDRMVLAALILADLLAASATTYLGNLLLILVANVLLILGLSWLWRQYREHTAPSQFDRPRPTAKPDIPLLVRLLLLPGISRWAGPMLTSKARAIRFMRTDRHHQALAARKAERRHTFSRATGTIPTDHRQQPPAHNCETDGHIRAWGVVRCVICNAE